MRTTSKWPGEKLNASASRFQGEIVTLNGHFSKPFIQLNCPAVSPFLLRRSLACSFGRSVNLTQGINKVESPALSISLQHPTLFKKSVCTSIPHQKHRFINSIITSKVLGTSAEASCSIARGAYFDESSLQTNGFFTKVAFDRGWQEVKQDTSISFLRQLRPQQSRKIVRRFMSMPGI